MRRILPLDVLGTAPGLVRITRSGGTPTAAVIASPIARLRMSRRPGARSLVSATTMIDSVPAASSRRAKAATQPWRTPETPPAAASISCG